MEEKQKKKKEKKRPRLNTAPPNKQEFAVESQSIRTEVRFFNVSIVMKFFFFFNCWAKLRYFKILFIHVSHWMNKMLPLSHNNRVICV